MQVGDIVRITINTPEGAPCQPYVFGSLGEVLFVIKGHWYTVRIMLENMVYTFHETEIVKATVGDIYKLYMAGYISGTMHNLNEC